MQTVVAKVGAVLLATAVLFCGCQEAEKPRLEVTAVRGKVLINGTPPVKAEVTLRAAAGLHDPGGRSIAPYGTVKDDGSFTIGTYTQDDGAPVGEYAVTIVWPKITIEGGEESRGEDRLRGRYASAEKPAAKFTVQAGANEIPLLDLKTR